MKTLIVIFILLGGLPAVSNSQETAKSELTSGECIAKAKRGRKVTAFKFDERSLFIDGHKVGTAVFLEPAEKDRPLMIKYQMTTQAGSEQDYRWASLEYNLDGDLEVSIMARVPLKDKPTYKSVCSQKIKAPKNGAIAFKESP